MLETAPESTAAVEPIQGLDAAEAARRLRDVGRNEIRREKGVSPWLLFARQFASPVVWLLLAACAVSGALGELAEAVAIGAIVLVNAVVGFVQEYRAEQALLALRAMTAPRARVVRDGASRMIAAAEVVPGDVLVLEAGDVVAADATLLEAHALLTNEAPLTGESTPVEKSTQPAAQNAALSERRDTVFMGTSVTKGTGVARVAATGMQTELGKIAHLLTTAEESETPLQIRLARVSRTLLYICLGIVAVVAALGLRRGLGLMDVFMSAVSLAVAAVPEGLPAVVTIALASGVQRMARRHALVRRLHAVETLGSATVICTDKTGTLTTGVMVVRQLWRHDETKLLDAAAACCDAELGPDRTTGTGDPTEVAILRAAAERGIERQTIERERPRVRVVPFDSERRYMAVERADGALYVKGALEVVASLCSRGTEGAQQAADELATQGLRVLAVAIGRPGELRDLELVGLVGIADPPRPEAIDAIAMARAAGIETVMITGDHPVTARAIATELGIAAQGEDGGERVHARATPEDKINIVRSWKSRGAVVAMTGDGVNDAPALREAHIGIAMGKTGTEVTREAADIVLTDDNFASIVRAVREGRGIFDNIRKTLVYLLAGNTGELGAVFGASLLGFPLPFLPFHLLWINLITDGFPALALVTDRTSDAVMKRKPRPLEEPMLGRLEWATIVWVAALEMSVTLAVYAWGLANRSVPEARTWAFTVLVFGELLRAFSARDRTRLLWEIGATTNLRLLAVVAVSAGLQLAVLYVPALRALFELSYLAPAELATAALIALIPVSTIEISKLIGRIGRSM